eukprot:UN01999
MRIKGIDEMPFVWSLLQGKESYELLELECQKIDQFIKLLKDHANNPVEGFEAVLKFIVTFVSDLKCLNLVRGIGTCSSTNHEKYYILVLYVVYYKFLAYLPSSKEKFGSPGAPPPEIF